MSSSPRLIPGSIPAKPPNVRLKNVLRRLAKCGPERQAIEAGEIDAVIDYSSSNVILFPAARRAMREAANRASAVSREAANKASLANSLLGALPHAEYQRLLTGLEPVTLKFGEVLHEQGVPIRYVYFPIDSVICLLTKVEGQRALEVGVVGYEGMVGISLVLGVDVSSVRTLVQAAGTAMRMKAARFRNEFRQCLSLQRELYRYTYAKLAMARQSVACNRFHAIEARIAHWLLMISDRVPSNEIFLTQEFMADILGVRRTSVNKVASSFRQRNLISYSRGTIRILNREGLEAASCSCYTRIEGPHDSV
jgi:CRP-like cAMP-binding protein